MLAKRMGTPVTDRTERAAPPRASPSSLVSTTPDPRRAASLNVFCDVHRLLAGHAVDDRAGFRPARRLSVQSRSSSDHHLVVDVQAPRRIQDERVAHLLARNRVGPARTASTTSLSWSASPRATGTSIWLPRHLELIGRRGAVDVEGDQQRFASGFALQESWRALRRRWSYPTPAAPPPSPRPSPRRQTETEPIRSAEQLGELLVDNLDRPVAPA